MALSLEDAARLASMQEDHQALQDAIWAAEAGRDQLVASFQGELDGQMAALRKQVLDVRGMAEHAMLLDPDSDVDDAHVRPSLEDALPPAAACPVRARLVQPSKLVAKTQEHEGQAQDAAGRKTHLDSMQAYAANLLEQVQGLRRDAEQLADFERLFQFPETELPELEDTLLEVEMKETLWRTLSSFAEQCHHWSAESFFEVCTCSTQQAHRTVPSVGASVPCSAQHMLVRRARCTWSLSVTGCLQPCPQCWYVINKALHAGGHDSHDRLHRSSQSNVSPAGARLGAKRACAAPAQRH